MWYSTTKIQKKEEEAGFWIFKTKQAVRRITCFILGMEQDRDLLGTATLLNVKTCYEMDCQAIPDLAIAT